MIEIEVKGYADDMVFERVRDRFKFIRREYHEDTYFQHPCRDFARTDEALRIRIKRFDGHFEAFLTYKGPKIDSRSKSRREVEVPIQDPDRHMEILTSLGFRKVLTIKKVREKYYVGRGVVIDLDEIEGLGKFVEAEAIAEREDVLNETVERLIRLLKELGVERFERRSYLELILGREVEHGEVG
ncbi:class IV adenylate cyclase [Thermococcus sp. M36]|uniref:class IV adenylate cyclase n=1 Tax=Thermococcus sp. M36 TaxID=1638261 RepID=UPI00143B711C|nr:class IV adenylate cyclase [Thermococcus sp. M36]NJE06403.1 class IV adenylate cyclase [Thermococcus sp. M36]